jgi:integrase/recombinase XerD
MSRVRCRKGRIFFLRKNKRRDNHITAAEFYEVGHPDVLSELSFDEALEIFLRETELKNLSVYTRNYYERELLTFKRLLVTQDIDTTPMNITTANIEDNLIRYMANEQKLKTTTINTRLRAIRAFFNFLHKKRYIFANPMKDTSLLRDKKNNIVAFNKEQVGRLLKQPELKTFTGVRDYTIMLVFLETGIRLKELASLEVNDIKWEDSKILIRNPKGYKIRLVPFQRDMKKQLQAYCKLRGDIIDCESLFVTIDDTPLTSRQIQHRLKAYGKKANITGVRVSPHTFRHTFAKMCVQGGANIFELQQILGHSSMDMVRTYVNLFSDEVKERHKEFSPLRQLRNRN